MSWLDELSIAVIAKECLPGRVKTRLSPPVSNAQAARLAQLSLSQTLGLVRDISPRRALLFFEGTPRPEDATGFEVRRQVEGTLDHRLAAICEAVEGPLIIIGMDTPQAQIRDFDALFTDWARAEPRFPSWLGLAEDGGFWALALARPKAELLLGVPMSTSHTGTDQYHRLLASGLTVGMLPELRDVDYFADALQVAGECADSSFADYVHELQAQLSSGEDE